MSLPIINFISCLLFFHCFLYYRHHLRFYTTTFLFLSFNSTSELYALVGYPILTEKCYVFLLNAYWSIFFKNSTSQITGIINSNTLFFYKLNFFTFILHYSIFFLRTCIQARPNSLSFTYICNMNSFSFTYICNIKHDLDSWTVVWGKLSLPPVVAFWGMIYYFFYENVWKNYWSELLFWLSANFLCKIISRLRVKGGFLELS